MKIIVNEREVDVPVAPGIPTTIATVIRKVRPGADTYILNGFPVLQTELVREGDNVVIFRKSEKPVADELDALLSARHTPGVAKRLREAAVGIAGLGGLGSTVAVALARAGVGRLVLVDFDVVEPSNINRQQYFLDQLGEKKVEALAATLKRIRPHLQMAKHDVMVDASNAVKLFEGCDVVVEAFDTAERKVELIETLQSKLPSVAVVAGSGMAGYGPNNDIKTEQAGNLFVCGDEVAEAQPGMGLMAPRVGICAHHQANQVLRILMGEDQAPPAGAQV